MPEDASPPAPVRVGVIGAGAIAMAHHLPALARAPGATVVAVADPDPGARDRAGRAVDADVLDDPGALLARGDLDAVVIGAPSHLHADLATAAAQAGLHAYIEKPVAIDAAGAERVRRAVEAAGTVAVVGLNRRMHPLYRQARRLVARGRIGPLVAAQTIFSEPFDLGGMPEWKRDRSTGGGVLLDLASHHLDQLRWLDRRRGRARLARRARRWPPSRTGRGSTSTCGAARSRSAPSRSAAASRTTSS